MNNAIDKIIKFSYYKNRIITTIGLIIGVFNPLLGFPIVLIAYYSYHQSTKIKLLKPNKDEKLFMILSLVLLGAFLLIYFITIIETLGQVGESSSLLRLY